MCFNAETIDRIKSNYLPFFLSHYCETTTFCLGWASTSKQSHLGPSYQDKNYISHFSKYPIKHWLTFEHQSPLVAVGIMTLVSSLQEVRLDVRVN